MNTMSEGPDADLPTVKQRISISRSYFFLENQQSDAPLNFFFNFRTVPRDKVGDDRDRSGG